MAEPRASIAEQAELVVGRLLAVKRGEQLAIVCDFSSDLEVAFALAEVASAAGADASIHIQPDRETGRKNELAPVIARALERADCLIGMTRTGGAPSYAAAVKRLYEQRHLRGISMVMRTTDNFTAGGALADHDALSAEGERLAERWRTASRIHVSASSGTDLRATVGGESVCVECGFATEPGDEAAFSDGEVSQMPNQGSAEGLIVVDGPMAHLGSGEPVALEVRRGRVVSVDGAGSRPEALRDILARIPEADNVAEIGVGLNPACRLNGDFEEEKKARGLVHVALGDNVFYGGAIECAVHLDMVIYQPTLTLDDQPVVSHGEIVFPAPGTRVS